jgi:orotidine-5'-phosphate decarboxylase
VIVTSFQEKVAESIIRKGSYLSVGLDPGLPGQVSQDAVPSRFLRGKDTYKGLLDFCLHVIDEVADSVVAIKITHPYVMGFTDEHHQALTSRMRDRGVLSIYDMKLGAIFRTAFAAVWYCHRWGYDAVTLNPYRGDLRATIKAARDLKPSLATLVTVLSSDPGSSKYTVGARIGVKPVTDEIVSDLVKYRPDGCLLGSGKYVRNHFLSTARRSLGVNSVFLFVVGNHLGEAKRVLRNAGQTSLINVGRDIIYSRYPGRNAETWVKKLRSLLGNPRRNFSARRW